ncbi:MAG: WYL domain-containing protein [Actinobacteria bacterium]|nr:WYL domain-containing protein [Actinomycetota bacterium]
MRRALERLLNLLAFLLTADRPVTAEEIRITVAGYAQDSDDAFHRMFERDKDLLRRMGIPIELRPTDTWEVEYGYFLHPDAYQLPDPDLSDEERAALWLAAQVVRLGGQPSGADALMKLGGLAMSGGGEPLAADLGSGAEDLSTAHLAATERRMLSFTYRGRRRTVQPMGILHQRGHWYLIARDREEMRAYRVDRASAFALGDHPGAFTRPAGFSLKDALPGKPWAAGEADIIAKVVFDADTAWWAKRQLGANAVERPDGALEAELRVANPDAFIGWILGFEDKAEILQPEHLRQALIDRVRERS